MSSVKKKKIGIVTYHHVLNEGAILQAYALALGVKQYIPECDAEIIDYRPWNMELREFIQSLSAKSPFVLLRKFFRGCLLRRFIRQALPLSSRTMFNRDFKVVVRNIREKYAAVITGSDEVWKIENRSLARPFPNMYWLPGDLGAKKFAFAASANKNFYEKLEPSRRKWICDALNDFSLIGVRDNHTFNFVRSAGVMDMKKVYKIPDPTFMFDLPEVDLRNLLEKCGVDFKKPLVGILVANKSINRSICEYFRGRDYQTVAIVTCDEFADVSLVGKIDPLQWACVFKYFTLSVTGRFHGAVFSLKNKVPFVIVEDMFNYGDHESKILSLLRDLSPDFEVAYMNIGKEPFSLETFTAKVDAVRDVMSNAAIDDGLVRMKDQCVQFLRKMNEVMDGA